MRALVALCVLAMAGYAIATTTPQSSGSISIYAPWSGSTVYTGQTFTISYSTLGMSSMFCTISYQASSDFSWTQITGAASGSYGTGTYSWYVPSYFPTGSYRIQVTDNGSNAYGTSDYFTVSSQNTTALAVGWIVFIVIAVFLCVACGVCVQYRRRQAFYAANNRYALMSGATTTTVITIPPGQAPMPQAAPGTNPPMIYSPDPMQQQYAAPQYAAPTGQPAYGVYQPVQQVTPVVPVAYGMAPPMYAPAPTTAPQYQPPPAYAPGMSTGGQVGGQLNMQPTA